MAGLAIPLDDVIHFDAVTHDPSTGGQVTATSVTFDVFEEATDTPIRVNQTMIERTSQTGVFRGTDTISAANGYEVGKYYSVVSEATAGGVTGHAVLLAFRCVAAETIAGVSEVDLTHISGGAVPTPAVTGVPDVNVTHHVDVAASVTNGELDVNVGQIIGTAPTITTGDLNVNIVTIASAAITAAAIATDAIDADAVATDAVNEIRNAITGGAWSISTDSSGRVKGGI